MFKINVEKSPPLMLQSELVSMGTYKLLYIPFGHNIKTTD